MAIADQGFEDDDDAELSAPADVRTVTITLELAGERLDRALSLLVEGISRARLQALLAAGAVSDGVVAVEQPSRRVKAGESFVVTLPPPEPAEPAGEAIALDIRHEDRDLIVIDKPAGLVVHPAAGHQRGTLVNALIAHCGDTLSGIGGVRRPGIVHRLDKDTSGLLVVAKTDAAHQGLSAQFASHGLDGRLVREYRALVWGSLGRTAVTIDADIGRSPAHRTRMAVVKSGGRRAVTHVEVRAEIDASADAPKAKRPRAKGTAIVRRAIEPGHVPTLVSDLRVRLETGRTHQIRVHLAHLGHPVLGDTTYGAGFKTRAAKVGVAVQVALEALGRQALHAAVLGFEHPVTGAAMLFHSAPPADMQRLIDALENGG
jgi:23S rRNA pseudouridine1911/1915/1917 synthase